MNTHDRALQAVIFDMDGVLLDSEHAMRTASIMALREWGVQAQEQDFIPFTGAGDDRFVGGVAEQYGVAYDPAMKQRTYAIYLTICHDAITRFEAIPQTIAALADRGLKLAVASSADRIKVTANITAAGIDPALLSVVVTGDDVTRKKPDPAAFLLAAERMGVEPARCVVVEDAVNGIQAACNAGMHSIGILSTFPRQALEQAGATLIAQKTCQVPALIDHIIT